MILFEKDRCVGICLKNKNKYVYSAAEDMKKDFKRISKSHIMPMYDEEKNGDCIVIEENIIEDSKAVEDESFSIRNSGGRAVIASNSYLGTMWGIYTFCERILGADPCYLFDDTEITEKDSLTAKETEINEKPDGFGFRGFFVNDEDLLIGWKDGGGSVINFASMNSYCPLTRCFAYAMSKAAISNLTQSFAAYFAAAGIRINAIAPGFIVNERSKSYLGTVEDGLTERGKSVIEHTPMRSFGRAGDLVGCVKWLLDDEVAGFVTGITVPVDGGFLTLGGV